MRTLLLAAVAAWIASHVAAPLLAQNKTDPKAKIDPKKKDAPESKFNMKLTIADIRLGTYVMGEKVTKEDLKGRVVLVDDWGINCPPCLKCMPMTAAMNAELADFGLLVLGSHRQGGTVDEVKAAATARGANFPISISTQVAGAEDNRFLPHCILFDHTGACIFRGSPFEVETLVRAAVGKAIVESANREKFSASVKPIAEELKKGKAPLTLVSRLVALQNATGDAGADAKALLATLTVQGQKKLDQAETKLESEPVEAFLLVEKLPTTFKGTPVALKASEMLVKLKKDKTVAAEIAARPSLETLRRFEQQMLKPGDDPKKPEFQKANAAALKQISDKIKQMKKAWPEAPATKAALVIGEKFGVQVQ